MNAVVAHRKGFDESRGSCYTRDEGPTERIVS
jgi:hypothetical protein